MTYTNKVHTYDTDSSGAEDFHSLIWGITEDKRGVWSSDDDGNSGEVQRGFIRSERSWIVIRRWLSSDITITRYLMFNCPHILIRQIHDPTFTAAEHMMKLKCTLTTVGLEGNLGRSFHQTMLGTAQEIMGVFGSASGTVTDI